MAHGVSVSEQCRICGAKLQVLLTSVKCPFEDQHPENVFLVRIIKDDPCHKSIRCGDIFRCTQITKMDYFKKVYHECSDDELSSMFNPDELWYVLEPIRSDYESSGTLKGDKEWFNIITDATY